MNRNAEAHRRIAKPALLNRRGFVQMAGMTALGLQAKGLHSTFGSANTGRPYSPHFVYVGVMGRTSGIHVFAAQGKQWRLLQVVASEAPVSLALHPSGGSLYVLNEVAEYRNLPRGSIEAYAVDTKTGMLTLLGREALALSATMPRHVAVAPDGRQLMVAVHGGGAYNLMPILADGRVGRVCGVVKEAGRGQVREHQETAHPQAVVFDSTGQRVIASDLGTDRLSVLSLEGGLELQERYTMPVASGPQHLALHPSGHLLYVSHGLNGGLSAFGYDATEGKVTELRMRVPGQYVDALAFHPVGDILYAASRGATTAWRVDSLSGTLHPLQSRSMKLENGRGKVHGVTLLRDGRELAVLASNGVLRMTVDEQSGCLGEPELVAQIANARCFTIRQCEEIEV